MNEDSSIRLLLNRIESAHLEHKSAEATDEVLAQAACAFLNSGGGTIIVEAGRDKNRAVAREAEIQSGMRKHIAPAAFWSVDLEEIGGNFYKYEYDARYNMTAIRYIDGTSMEMTYYPQQEGESIRSLKEPNGKDPWVPA